MQVRRQFVENVLFKERFKTSLAVNSWLTLTFASLVLPTQPDH